MLQGLKRANLYTKLLSLFQIVDDAFKYFHGTTQHFSSNTDTNNIQYPIQSLETGALFTQQGFSGNLNLLQG